MKKNESFYCGLYLLHGVLYVRIYCRKKGEVMIEGIVTIFACLVGSALIVEIIANLIGGNRNE